VNNLGVLTYLTVTNVSITASTIAVVPPFVGADVTLRLRAAGAGTVDVGASYITNVSTASFSDSTQGMYAANKNYVDNLFHLVGTKGFALTLDITGIVNPTTTVIPTYLNYLLPPTNPSLPAYDLPVGARCRVLCYISAVNIPTTVVNMTESFTNIGGQSVVTGVAGTFTVAGSNATVPPGYLNVKYTSVEEFVVNTVSGSNIWQWNATVVTF